MGYDVSTRPGAWVSAQARRRSLRVWLLVAVGLGLMLLVIWVSLGWHASGLALLLLLPLYALSQVADQRGRMTANWLRGAASERAVGRTLAELVGTGYYVMHDIEQQGEGNIDHLVSGPTGVYLIETKHRGYRERDLVKAKRQAAKLHGELGVWVTPVLCLDRRELRRSYRDRGVWIVTREQLVSWLRTQRNPAVPFARLASFADAL